MTTDAMWNDNITVYEDVTAGQEKADVRTQAMSHMMYKIGETFPFFSVLEIYKI